MEKSSCVNGKCSIVNKTFVCLCNQGFTGKNCKNRGTSYLVALKFFICSPKKI